MAEAVAAPARLLRTTAVRLALLYSVIFGLLAIGVVAYISISSGQILLRETRLAVDEEVRELDGLYRRFGTRRFVRAIERRSRRPGANLYRVVAQNGDVLAGNVGTLNPRLLERAGWRRRPFAYGREGEITPSDGRAIGRVFKLSQGTTLLVGRDVSGLGQVARVVRRAATIAVGTMVLTALLLTLILGRRAVRRLDRVTETTGLVVAGDLSQRLPESGNGDEYDRLSAALNAVLARVETLNTGIRSVSDSIAHDLRTPLTRLRNKAESALADVGPQAIETIQDIVAEADELVATFDAVLLISQTQSGAQAIPMQALSARRFITDIYELFEPMVDDGNLSVSLNCDPDINGNRELLARALSNLLDNALKYAGSDRDLHLELDLSCLDGMARFAVADNGDGISPEDREHALTRFGRLEGSRSQPGSGLGLALVDATVRAHGGRLLLEDNKPGLRAIMELPIAP